MAITLMDCTLRDGANVVGKGFSKDLTDMMLDGLTACHVPIIEIGNSGGIGAYEVSGFTNAETDQTYFEIAQKYKGRGSKIGMFLNAKRYREENILLAKSNGMDFLRVGADAGDHQISLPIIKKMRENNMEVFYSLMKAYLLSPEQLAEEGKRLEDAGLNVITIMDSAGTMTPDEVAVYTQRLADAVSIPVAFHGHNNLGLSAANALAAYRSGASILDCGLMGMARSAGNFASEVCVALMQRYGEMLDVDLYGLLKFIDEKLQPAMREYGYQNPIKPLDLILGYSGCHSSFVGKFKEVAGSYGADLYKLISEVSLIDRKAPSEQLMVSIAEKLKDEGTK